MVVAAALTMVSCGDPGTDSSGTGIAGAGDAAEASPGPLLAFTATTLDGKAFDGMSLAGKPAVLWFWAPWCPICLQQAPGVRAAVAKYAGKVNIIGVAGLDKTAAMPEFVRLAKVGQMRHIADEPGVVWKRFEVVSQSTFVLINAAGQVTFRGRLSAKEVPTRVGALLGA